MGLGEKEEPCKSKGISSRLGKKWELIWSTGDYRQIGKKKGRIEFGFTNNEKTKMRKK